jgi:hypothetical protein
MQRYPPEDLIPVEDVFEEFEIPNGLLGAKRDTFLKLSTYHANNPDTIRQMYGISTDPYNWKNHIIFKRARLGLPSANPKKLDPKLPPPPPPRPKFKYHEPIAKQHLPLSKF